MYEWEDKEEMAAWFGQCTGSTVVTVEFKDEFVQEHWDMLTARAHAGEPLGDLYPRLELILQGARNPDLLKAEFNFNKFRCWGLFDLFDEMKPKITPYTFPVPYDSHMKYKYLLSLDGNGAAWLRLPWILYSNSLLLKQDSENVQWFYGGLKKNVHFLPIKSDISDTIDVIEYARENEEEVL